MRARTVRAQRRARVIWCDFQKKIIFKIFFSKNYKFFFKVDDLNIL